jgi:hypothetical protein
MTLDKRCDILFLDPPMRSPSQWPGTVRSSTDAGLSPMDTAFFIWPSPYRFRLACSERRMVRFAQVLEQFFFQHPTRLNEQAAIDRLV